MLSHPSTPAGRAICAQQKGAQPPFTPFSVFSLAFLLTVGPAAAVIVVIVALALPAVIFG
jgi:hypothetical protein